MEQAVSACVFAKGVPAQLETEQVLQGLRSGLLQGIGGEERPPPTPLLSSTPIPSIDCGTLILETQCSFHRPHITIVEEAAGGFSNSLNATISYTPLR